MESTSDFSVAPAPWTLKATIYAIPFWLTSKNAASIPSHLIYHAVEYASSFSADKALGGLSMIQIIRYIESPVGPYDEMVILPGSFAFDKNGKNIKGLRATCLYVSQKETCYNGRLNWNMPKHLANFTFNSLKDGGIQIIVSPVLISGQKSIKPFFNTIFKSIAYSPTFPMNTKLASYVGYDLSLVQPPLPLGQGDHEAGTEEWSKVLPLLSSNKCSVGWFDLKQESDESRRLAGDADERTRLLHHREGEADTELGSQAVIGETQFDNWFPGWGRWKFGTKMEDAIVEFGVGEKWKN